MLQFSQITETLSDLVGNLNTDNQDFVQNILGDLQDGGLNLSELSGMNAVDVMERINLAGIDLGEYTPEQIVTALQTLDIQEVGLDNLEQLGSQFSDLFDSK